MKFQKAISKLLAAGIAATAFAGGVLTANASEINDAVADGMRVGSVGTGVKADYDSTTKVLTLSGTGTITSTKNGAKGAGITGSSQNLVIQLADGADVTVNGIDKGADSYGIYQFGGSVTIKGAGKLTVNAATGTSESVGICTYNKTNGSLYITDGATVVANGSGTTGKGVNVYHSIYGNSNIELSNGGKLIAAGQTYAVDVAPTGYAVAKASTSVDGTGAVEFEAANVATYKYAEFTAAAEEPEAPSGVYVASKQITSEGWTKDDLSASYDADTKTLTFTGKGTVDAAQISVGDVVTYGAGIFTNNDGTLTIQLADGADVTVNGKSHVDYEYSYGIYAPNADIKITGNGKLTVNAPQIASTSQYALSNAIQTSKNVTIDGAAVDAVGLASASAYGSRGISAACISLTNNAILNAKGATRAVQISTDLSIYENAAVKAAKQYDGTELNPFVNEYTDTALKAYKLVCIKPQTYTSTTDNKGGFVSDDEKKTDDKNDEITVFETNITGTEGTIDTIYWNVKSGATEKALFPSAQPALTLNGGSAAVTVIVKGLANSEATAAAVIF